MNIRQLKQIDILNKIKPLSEHYDVKFSKSNLSLYLSGKSEPNQDKLFILSEALNVNVAWLMGYDVPMTNYQQVEKNNIESLIIKEYGEDSIKALSLYTQLDSNDRAEIRGEMKQMLKADKYSIKNESKNA